MVWLGSASRPMATWLPRSSMAGRAAAIFDGTLDGMFDRMFDSVETVEVIISSVATILAQPASLCCKLVSIGRPGFGPRCGGVVCPRRATGRASATACTLGCCGTVAGGKRMAGDGMRQTMSGAAVVGRATGIGGGTSAPQLRQVDLWMVLQCRLCTDATGMSQYVMACNAYLATIQWVCPRYGMYWCLPPVHYFWWRQERRPAHCRSGAKVDD